MRSFTQGFALLVLSLSPVLATTSASMAASSTPAPMRHVVGDIPLAQTVASYDAVAYGYRASKLIGSSVYNDEHKVIGRVADIVITRRYHVSFFVLSVGGFLGMDAKDVAISASRLSYQGNHMVLAHATKKMLLDLPTFHFAH
jgi:sporulation protein YlmC with PRC-barrel domain